MTYDLLYGNKSNDTGKSTLTPWTLEEYLAIERGQKSAAWHMYNWQKLRILAYGREQKWTNAGDVQQLEHNARVAFVTRICDGKPFDEEVCEALFVRFTKWYFQYRNNARKWSTARYPDPAAMTATIADYNRRDSSTSIPDAGLGSASTESLHDDHSSGSDASSTGPIVPTFQSESQQTGDQHELAGSVHPSGRLRPIVRALEQEPTRDGFYGDSKTANQWLAHLDETLPYPFTSQDDVDRWVTGFEASLKGPALQWATEHADDIFEADHVTLDTAQKLRSDFLRKFGFDVNTYDGSAKPIRWLRQLDNALENFSETPEYSAIWLEIFAASMRGPAKQWACDDSHIRQLKSRASDSIGKQHIEHVKARFLSCFPCDSRQADVQRGKRAGKKPARDESPGASDDFSSPASKEAHGEEEDVVPENVVEAADALSEILEGMGLH